MLTVTIKLLVMSAILEFNNDDDDDKALQQRKTNKYSPLTQSYLFVTVAAETMGTINKDGMDYLSNLGRCITQSINDYREFSVTLRSNSTLQCGRCLGYLYPHNP